MRMTDMGGVCQLNPYTLPTIDFVGGETQDLAFHVYFHQNKKPFPLGGCTAKFAVVSYMNPTGKPVLNKDMGALPNADGTDGNTLTVTLRPEDTAYLAGKYIYQISIRDIDGDVEIPKQGILYIANNIHKDFIQQ